jgi:tRNA dimethylallyltransferase
MAMKPVVILGCTAAGKSDLGEALAGRLGERAGLGRPVRVMAVDSMQVYRGMDIGTAKPDAATRARIPYLMVDVAEPWEAYSAARFVAEARPYLEKTKDERRKTKEEDAIVLVGGTILYLRALMEGLFEGPSADEGMRAELNERARVAGSGMLHAE